MRVHEGTGVLSEKTLSDRGVGEKGHVGVRRVERKPARKDGRKMVSRLNAMREKGTEKKRAVSGMKFHRGNSIKSNIPVKRGGGCSMG